MDCKELRRELNRLQQENAMLRELLAKHSIPIPVQALCVDDEKTLCKAQKLEIRVPHIEGVQLKHPVQDNGRGGDAPLNTAVVQSVGNAQNAASMAVQVAQALSPEQKIAIFRSLFRGREDVFARRWYSVASGKSGYQPVCLREWNAQFCDKKKYKCADCPNRQFAPLTYKDIYCHLQGKDEYGRDVVGLYAIQKDNTCYFLCADFDDKSCEHGYQKDVLAYTSVCRDWRIPYAIERSRSGNGAHVWVFFVSPTPAIKARKLGNAILSEAMNREARVSLRSYDRLFPNQDTLPAGGLGNLIALPMQGKARRSGNSVFVNESFTPYPDQWAFLQSVARVSEATLDRLLEQHQTQHELGELSASSESKPWCVARPTALSQADFQSGMTMVRSNMLYVPLSALSAKALNHLKRIAAFKNPEFYSRQAMRLSTRNVPRIISCAELSDDYLALPRGCEDDVVELLHSWMIPYTIQDETYSGRSIHADFMGNLRKEQACALSAMCVHRLGVLSAATAFGKTVTIAALIAQKQVNTLVLVHSKALLVQWKNTLEKFLSITYQPEDTSHKRGRKKTFSPIGMLSSDGDSLHGMVDIAVMQSCVSDKEVKPFVRNYGMVIVDECHHVPAFTFEQVLKFANARYVYGLTATPIRKDGHQPIIFMQCGKICYTSDAKAQKGNQTFQRVLIPRYTSYRTITDEKPTFPKIVRQIAEDENRNEMIVEDVKQSLQQGRTPIVLSNLTSHVALLAEKIGSFCPNVITLVGSDSAKAKRETMLRLEALPDDTPVVIVATGKYIGEGFDYPRLDTLFLTSPISWKGLLAQYAGRLHREYVGKRDVQIYDYVDIHQPVCELMYRRRLKGYASIGYTIQTDRMDTPTATSAIFTGKDYADEFCRSINSAKHTVLIACPHRNLIRHIALVTHIRAAMARGVEVMVVLPAESVAAAELEQIGVTVKCVEQSAIRTTIVDRSVIWYGDVDVLGEGREQDTMICFRHLSLAAELTDAILKS